MPSIWSWQIYTRVLNIHFWLFSVCTAEKNKTNIQYSKFVTTKSIQNWSHTKSLPSQYYSNICDLKKRRETHCLQKERVLWTKYKYLDHSVTWWRQISFYLKLPVANWRRGNRKKSFFYFCISQTWLIFAPQYTHYIIKVSSQLPLLSSATFVSFLAGLGQKSKFTVHVALPERFIN